MPACSRPFNVEEVETPLEEAGNPFEVEERLAALAKELKVVYLGHDTNAAVVATVDGGDVLYDPHSSELIAGVKQLLAVDPL